ncbi:MAG: hypothetical protein NCA08_12510 [Deltaproteobacteria bacterium]|nr:hypothetical protein [Candidatus Deferrimicrobium borealis]
MTHVDEDVDGIRSIQRKGSSCQPQQVLVVVHPFIDSHFQYGPNGMSGVITEIADVLQSIDRDRSHRFLLLSPSFTRVRAGILVITDTVILPASLRYRHPSESRAPLCLIPGPVFVLWPDREIREDSGDHLNLIFSVYLKLMTGFPSIQPEDAGADLLQ